MRILRTFILVLFLLTPLLVTASPTDDLFAATERGDNAGISKLAANGADVNSMKGNLTPLFVAVRSNRLPTVKVLLALGADPNLASPIFVAIQRDTEIVRALIDAGANVNTATKPYKYTALGSAAYNADPDFRKQQRSGKYHGPLPSSLETVRLLIKAGADINHVDKFRESALRVAVRVNNIPMVRLLLELGADVHQYRDDPSVEEQSGNTILMEAIHWYSVFKNTQTIKVLLEHGANSNDKNTRNYDEDCDENYGGKCTWRGYTVLTYAAKEGYFEVAKLLLEHGADPKATRQDGKIAYEVARQNKHFKTAELIREYMTAKGVSNERVQRIGHKTASR
jgi:ankyrin repeat protein